MKHFSIFLFVLINTALVLAQNSSLSDQWLKNDQKKAIEQLEANHNNLNYIDELELSLMYTYFNNSDKVMEHYQHFYDKGAVEDKIATQNIVFGLWSERDKKLSEKEFGFVTSVLEGSSNEHLITQANLTLAQHYYYSKNFSKSKEYFDKLGILKKWQTVGVFDNISGSGFYKEFDALDHPEDTFLFKNKVNADVTWYTVEHIRKSGWLDFKYNYSNQTAIVYAQTFLNSPIQTQALLKLGKKGSIKIYVNDQLVFESSKEYHSPEETHWIQVNLEKGYNRILVQSGSNTQSEKAFFLRVTDIQGKSFANLIESAQPQSYRKKQGQQFGEITPKFISNLEKQAEKEPDAFGVNFTVLQYYILTQQPKKALKIIQPLQEKYPSSIYILKNLVTIYNLLENDTESDIINEKIKTLDIVDYTTWKFAYNEAIKNTDFEAANRLIDKYITLNGEDIVSLLAKVNISGKKSEVEKIKKQVNALYSRFPDKYEVVNLKYLVEDQLNSNKKRAKKVLSDFLENNVHFSAEEKLITELKDQGDMKNVISEYERLLQIEPAYVGYLNKIADVQYNQGRYQDAEKTLLKFKNQAPYVAHVYKSLAKVKAEQNQKNIAIDYYKKSFDYNPLDYDAKEKIRILEGKKKVYEEFDTVDIDEIVSNAPNKSSYPEDNAAILLEEKQKIIYREGGSEEKNIFLLKVFNSDAIDNWKQYDIPVSSPDRYRIEEAEVIKTDGSKLPAEISGQSVVFSNLEPGDIIHLEWVIYKYPNSKLSKDFWDTQYFQYSLPVKELKYSLLLPKDYKFNSTFSKSQLIPIQREIGENKMITWIKKDIPAIQLESYTPSFVDISNVLHLSSLRSWNEIAQMYSDMVSIKAEQSDVVQDLVNDLLKGNQDKSKLEKVKIFYNYIVNNIRYISVPFLQSGLIPQSASKVITTKQGDCKDVSTLFKTLCSYIDVRANLVLVNTSDNGLEMMKEPSLNFNHCIAKLSINDIDYYIELTSENLPFSSHYYTLENAFCLEIPNQEENKTVEPFYLNPSTRVRNEINREANIQFLDLDNLKHEKISERSGYLAAIMRDDYENIGEKMRFDFMQESIFGGKLSEKLISLDFSEGLTDNGEKIVYNYVYESKSDVSKISNFFVTKIPFTDSIELPDFFSTSEREYDIDMYDYFIDKYHETVILNLPEGYIYMDVPTSTKIDNPVFNYEIAFKLNKAKNQLETRRIFSIKTDIIKKEDYQKIKENFELVVESDNTQVAFKKS